MNQELDKMSGRIDKERERVQAEMENFRKQQESFLEQIRFERETYQEAWDSFSEDFFGKNDRNPASLKVRRLKHELEVLQRQLEMDLEEYQKKYRELVHLAEAGEI